MCLYKPCRKVVSALTINIGPNSDSAESRSQHTIVLMGFLHKASISRMHSLTCLKMWDKVQERPFLYFYVSGPLLQLFTIAKQLHTHSIQESSKLMICSSSSFNKWHNSSLKQVVSFFSHKSTLWPQ